MRTQYVWAICAVAGCVFPDAYAADQNAPVPIPLGAGFSATFERPAAVTRDPTVEQGQGAGVLKWKGALGGASADLGFRDIPLLPGAWAKSTIKPYVQLSRDLEISEQYGVKPYVRFDGTVPLRRAAQEVALEVRLGFADYWRPVSHLTLRQEADVSVRNGEILRWAYRAGVEWEFGPVKVVLPHVAAEGAPRDGAPPRAVVSGRFRIKF